MGAGGVVGRARVAHPVRATSVNPHVPTIVHRWARKSAYRAHRFGLAAITIRTHVSSGVNRRTVRQVALVGMGHAPALLTVLARNAAMTAAGGVAEVALPGPPANQASAGQPAGPVPVLAVTRSSMGADVVLHQPA